MVHHTTVMLNGRECWVVTDAQCYPPLPGPALPRCWSQVLRWAGWREPWHFPSLSTIHPPLQRPGHRASSRGDVQGRLQQQQLVRGWRLVSPVVPSSASHSVTTRPRYARRTLGWRIKTAYINVQTSVPISVWLTIFKLPFILFQF